MAFRRDERSETGQFVAGAFSVCRSELRKGMLPQDSPIVRIPKPYQQFLVEAAAIRGIIGVGFTRTNRGIRLDIITRDEIFSRTGDRCINAEMKLAKRLGITTKDIITR